MNPFERLFFIHGFRDVCAANIDVLGGIGGSFLGNFYA